MTAMPLQPFTAAETAHLARIEAAEPVDAGQDARVEKVARAIYEVDRRLSSWDDAAEWVRVEYRELAVAALAAMHPADETLRERLEALHSPVQWFEWKNGVEGEVDRSKPLPPFCRECTDDEYVDAVEMGDGLDLSTGDLVDWPCATIAVLDGEL